MTISGSHAVTIAGIADLTSGAGLNPNNMLITVTDAGVTTITEGGPVLSLFVPPGDDPGNTLGAADNATGINAAASGGLILDGADANFTTFGTVAGSTGDVITGSTTKGNVLIGSIGNDTLTGNASLTNPDTIVTEGGSNTITLAAGHTAIDHIGVYEAAPGTYAPGGVVSAFVPPNITGAAAGVSDLAQLGYWGLPTGGVQTEFGAAGAGGVTSADLSTVANFLPGTLAVPQDIVNFSVQAWGTGLNGAGGTNEGLTTGSLAVITHPANSPGGTAAVIQAVSGAATIGTATGVIQIGTPELNLAAVQSFVTGTALTFGTALPANSNAHMIVLWQDLLGNSHLSDLEIHAGAAAATATNALGGATGSISLSDMLQLTGVNETNIHAANIQFIT